MFAKYLTIEHQVQNAPNPTNISAMPSVKYYWNMVKMVPKIVQRLPVSETIYQALKSFSLSQKDRLDQVWVRL